MIYLPCAECGKKFIDITSFYVHFKSEHQNCSTYVCMMELERNHICHRSYGLYYSFRQHLSNIHHVPIRINNSQNPIVQPSEQLVDPNVPIVAPPDPPDVEHPLPVIEDDFEVNFKELLVQQEDLIVAKFYSNPAFPRNLVDKIVDDFSSYLTSPFFEQMEQLVLSSLDPQLPAEIRCKIEDMFDVMKQPFSHLQTEYKRFQYFENSDKYIAPIPYEIDFREERQRNINGITLAMKPVLGQLIPLRRVFKNFFQLPDVLEDTLAYMSSLEPESDWIYNVVQCSVWKRKRSMFNANDIVIPINVYYDEVEPNNALGPHCEPLGLTYIGIPVLPPEWNSRLENIFLAAVFDSDNRSVYRNKKSFQPLIDELMFLEKEGVEIFSPLRGQVQLYFVVCFILGDNKGLNEICGFMEGFNANHFCRICTCSRDCAKNMFVENPALLRSPESYMADVRADNPQVTGVKEECIFNQLPSFQTPSDISVDNFHDLVEGVAHYTMVPVLKHFNELNNMFIATLNNRLYGIDLGVDDDNRPPLINLDRLTHKGKLKMTGSEMTTFIRIFGVLVYDMVPKEDRFYELYLLLNDITGLLLAKHLHKEAFEILSYKIREHHELYVALTKESLKPKHHFLLHYPNLLASMGPFSQVSTIRYEAKHRNAKMTANSCSSRVNLPRTVAVKSQLGFCLRCVSNCSIRQPSITGPCNLVDLQELESYPSFSLTLPENVFTNPLRTVADWMTYKGTTYKPKQVVLYDVDDMGLFQFAIIEFIIVNDDKTPLFICSFLETLGFFSDVRGYEVRRDANVINFFALEHSSLLDPYPLWMYSMVSGENIILLKNAL